MADVGVLGAGAVDQEDHLALKKYSGGEGASNLKRNKIKTVVRGPLHPKWGVHEPACTAKGATQTTINQCNLWVPCVMPMLVRDRARGLAVAGLVGNPFGKMLALLMSLKALHKCSDPF